jgi:multiple sugar transport system substrate-binding protein
MYLKNVKKSILFTGRVCVFALKETKEAICHIGRIILYAFLVIFDAVCYAAKKTAGFAEKIAVKVKELILFIGRKITVIAVKIADVVQKAALKIKDAMHPVSRTDIFILAALLLVIITPIIINLFFKLNVKIRQVNLYVSVRSEELFGKELMEKLIREFEEKNPEINLKFAGNSSAAEPDVLFFSENDFGALAAGGSLMELNSFTNYDSGARQMAIPLVSFMDMLFYNIDILSAAGFSRPPKTRDEFINYAKTISRGDFQAAGYALSLSQKDRQALSRDVFSWIWASGGSLFSMNEDGAIVLTRAAKNDLSFFDTLNKEGTLAPNIFETTGDERLEAFVQGKTAMMIASTGVIPYLRAKMGDSKFGVTTIPVSAASGKYTISLSSIYAGISANSAYKEEAWNFLAFLASKSNVLCEKLNAVPGLVSNIIPGDYVKDDPFYSKAWDIFEASAVTESISAKPEAQEYENILLEELKPILEKN